MRSTVTPVADIAPLGHAEAMRLAEAEYERLLAIVEGLGPLDWTRPTDCPGWDVRAVLGHTLGMMERNADRDEEARQSGAAGRRAAATGEAWLDALTAIQVEEHAHLGPAELAARLRSAVPRALAGRGRTSEEERATRFRPAPPVDEEWTRGYLLDVIHTRDPWMHRVDIARATGCELVLTPGHDGRLVADVVAEWARRHGQPFTLVLDGPAGGSYVAGDGGEELHLDAVEFCRTLAGRNPATGLLAHEVPF